MHMFDGCTGFQGGGMMIGMFLFWAVLIFLGFYLMKSYMNGSQQSNNHLNILKERLAKGEISDAEYERLKVKLK